MASVKSLALHAARLAAFAAITLFVVYVVLVAARPMISLGSSCMSPCGKPLYAALEDGCVLVLAAQRLGRLELDVSGRTLIDTRIVIRVAVEPSGCTVREIIVAASGVGNEQPKLVGPETLNSIISRLESEAYTVFKSSHASLEVRPDRLDSIAVYVLLETSNPSLATVLREGEVDELWGILGSCSICTAYGLRPVPDPGQASRLAAAAVVSTLFIAWDVRRNPSYYRRVVARVKRPRAS